jgi:hypothetical protein
MGDPNIIAELAQRHIDFSGVPCFPPEIQAKLADPKDCNDLEVLRFLLTNSEISRILFKNPADFEMLEMVYFGVSIRTGLNGDCVDDWLSNSLPGQALRDRLAAVSSYLANHMNQMNNASPYILDLGAGPGPYAFTTLPQTKNEKVVLWDCVDLDRYALAVGEIRAQEQNLQDIIQFRQSNFMSRGSYPSEENRRADLGVLVGILCGMTEEIAIDCLQKIKPHFKHGAEIVAATLLVKSFEEAPTVFRVLCNILGWQLKPKTLDEVRAIFKAAGYDIISILTEREDGNGEYAIIHARI